MKIPFADYFPGSITVREIGLTDRVGWARAHLEDYGEHWAAVDRQDYHVVPYGEGLATYYAMGGPDPETIDDFWRFDTVSQRPPQVRPISRTNFETGAVREIPTTLPRTLACIFDRLEIDVVAAKP